MSDAALQHRPWEDVQGILTGIVLCTLAVFFLQQAGLVTGQMAGLAVLIARATGWEFGAVFFVLNLPFYVFALMRMGLRFTLRTFLAVLGVSVVAWLLPQMLQVDTIHPGGAAVLAGICAGTGLLVIFRHGASLGGVGILALYLQERTGLRAGWVQLGVDAAIFGAAFLVLSPAEVGWSLLGAVVLNAIIAVNHRRDRYIAM